MNKYSKHIYKKIKEYETIVIARHQNSDLDALGTQFALKEWIKINFPNKEVYCIGENHQKYCKEFIPKSDTFNGDKPFLGICVDVNSLNRIDGIEVFSKADYKICIDHHGYIEKNEFDFVYIKDEIISCAQILAQLMFDMKKRMNTTICKYLFAGISSDSGNFFFPATNYVTFDVASKLLKIGNFNQYNDIHLFVSMKSYRDLEITNYLFSKMVLDKSGVAYYINDLTDLNKLEITASNANEKISEFNRVEEIKIFIAASETEDHLYKCSIRSKTIPVNEIALKYGGGGHLFACGVSGISYQQLQDMIQDFKDLAK